MKFTFKTDKPTGKYSFVSPTSHYIKLKKKIVGSIGDEPPHKIRLRVKKKDIMEDGNPNCDWKWIVLKKESESLDGAKEFLNKHFEAINQLYELWVLD